MLNVNQEHSIKRQKTLSICDVFRSYGTHQGKDETRLKLRVFLLCFIELLIYNE